MLATLIPLFDETMTVKAYSLFTQKENYLLNPSVLGTGRNDGAGVIEGLDIIDNIGLETVAEDKEVFVEVNHISIFSAIEEQCGAPHSRIVLLLTPRINPTEINVNRLKDLKSKGYKLAIRKLQVREFEDYREILLLMDYVLLNHSKIDISKAKIYFGKIYPNIKLCAVNVNFQEEFDRLKADGGYRLYEGGFFRKPVTKGDTEIAPLKVNYIELLNVVNSADFDLTDAADVISRDAGLIVSLLKIVNRLSVNSEITSIRHAAAMLGQKELKRWINTAVANELCKDRPNEIMRLSLVRAKFAESLAKNFELAMRSDEIFLMGLFSLLDLMLDKPMEEALKMVQVSKSIEQALLKKSGDLAPILDFILQYENANWAEVFRQMILLDIKQKDVYEAYRESLNWYSNLFA